MKRAVITLLLMAFLGTSWSQLAFDAGLGSQNTPHSNLVGKRINFFSTNFSARYMGSVIFLKLHYRKGFEKTDRLFHAYNYTNWYSQVIEQDVDLKGTYSENNMGIGLGFTLPATGSLNRPYLGIDYCILQHHFQFENLREGIYIDREFFRKETAVNGKKFDFETSQIRLCAGFQFVLYKKLILYNEASINLYMGGFDGSGYCIDLGLRYFFTWD